MKKLFLAVMAAFTLLPFAQAADDHMETTRVVFFPYREAILSSRIDGIVLENTKAMPLLLQDCID